MKAIAASLLILSTVLTVHFANGTSSPDRGSLAFADKIDSGYGLILGYAIMVASFLLIYFGTRSDRDNTLAGQISFGRAARLPTRGTRIPPGEIRGRLA
jgi:hypothetical protein